MTEFKPRFIPTLRPFFSAVVRPRATDDIYRAAVVDKLAGKTDASQIDIAFKNGRGDVLFVYDHKWHLRMYGAAEAHELNAAGANHYQLDKFEARFLDEMNGAVIGVLRYNSEEGVCALQGITGRLHGFDQQVIAPLRVLSADAKSQLAADIFARKVSFVALPECRVVEQVLQADNGDYFVISNDRTSRGYEGYRLFTGAALDDLREIPVRNVRRLRDGGTTYYYTDEGVLYTPTSFNPELDAKWTAGGADADTENGVTLQKRDSPEIAASIVNPRIAGMARWQGPLVKPRDWRTGMRQ